MAQLLAKCYCEVDSGIEHTASDRITKCMHQQGRLFNKEFIYFILLYLYFIIVILYIYYNSPLNHFTKMSQTLFCSSITVIHKHYYSGPR